MCCVLPSGPSMRAPPRGFGDGIGWAGSIGAEETIWKWTVFAPGPVAGAGKLGRGSTTTGVAPAEPTTTSARITTSRFMR